MKAIEIVIFDDNKPRRELLQILINGSDRLVCTGIHENCEDVITKIGANVPDLVLMDIDMPYVNGIEGLKIIKQNYPGVKVLMQTVFEDDEKIFNAIVSGADGYILKKTPPVKLLEAIRDIMDGGSPMTPTVARQVLKLFVNKKSAERKINFELTERELELLGLLVKGMSYKMMAAHCNLSYATINTHISNIYEKLHVKSGTEAVAKAVKHNIITL